MHKITLANVKNSLALYKTLKIILGVVALFGASQILISVKPVAISLQTVILMLIGLTYTKEEAVATVGSYLACGAAGMPMFLYFSGGLAYMMGPTAGYLLGFLLSTYAMAYAREKWNLPNIYNCIIGSALIYIPGVAWLSTLIGFEAAFYKGFLLYIPSGIIKIALLVSILKMLKKPNA